LEKKEPAAPLLAEAVTAGDMAAIVQSSPDAIGYVGFGNLEPGLKLLAIDGVLPSEETAQDGSYRLVRPLLLLTGPLTQPLAQTFVDFALSDEGQQVVAESGWVPAKQDSTQTGWSTACLKLS
jgi:phosphate transport system substrate-binding protein